MDPTARPNSRLSFVNPQRNSVQTSVNPQRGSVQIPLPPPLYEEAMWENMNGNTGVMAQNAGMNGAPRVPGQKEELAIAVDFGTTYSGAYPANLQISKHRV